MGAGRFAVDSSLPCVARKQDLLSLAPRSQEAGATGSVLNPRKEDVGVAMHLLREHRWTFRCPATWTPSRPEADLSNSCVNRLGAAIVISSDAVPLTPNAAHSLRTVCQVATARLRPG